jgi:hypothetical protein
MTLDEHARHASRSSDRQIGLSPAHQPPPRWGVAQLFPEGKETPGFLPPLILGGPW